MSKLNYVIPFFLFLSGFFQETLTDNNTCYIKGEWSQVKLAIDPLGESQELTFTKDSLSDTQFHQIAKNIHQIYFSGQGSIDIEQKPSLCFSKKKISYKGKSLGRYRLSDDCKTITFIDLIKRNRPDDFEKCEVAFRYENIMAMEQGAETVIYLKRDPKNPYFVGE